jgi:hypothetical protein
MPALALSGAFLLVAGAVTWAAGAVAAKQATREVFTWAGVEHAIIDSLELSVVAGSAILLPWVFGLAMYSAWWKGGGGSNGGGAAADTATLLVAAVQALALSTLLLSATVTWTADMDAARYRLGGGPGPRDPGPPSGGGGKWGPPPPQAAPPPLDAASAMAAATTAPSAPPAGGLSPMCPSQCLDISAVVKVFKLPLPPCFCGQQWLLRDLFTHMDAAVRGLAAALSGAAVCWLGSLALVLWSSEERVRAVGGIFAGGGAGGPSARA